MKKITDNTFWGKLTLILNVLLLVFFILSMIFLMRFDKTNKAVVYERAAYDKTYENFIMAQHPLKQDSAEVAYYQYKLDTLKQRTAATRDEKKTLADAIEVTKNTLSEKQKIMDTHLEELAKNEATYAPAKAHWDEINAANDKTRSSFIVMCVITLIVFLAKIFVFAHYNYKNSKNLHAIADWMKVGMPSWLAYVSWIIPLYNLFKPLSFFKEIWEETDYILEDKGIVTYTSEQKDTMVDNSGLHIAIWWILLLCSTWLMSFILYKTFFTVGPLFLKASHGFIAIAAIVILLFCIVEEAYLILAYNKKNKMLVDNADKL